MWDNLGLISLSPLMFNRSTPFQVIVALVALVGEKLLPLLELWVVLLKALLELF